MAKLWKSGQAEAQGFVDEHQAAARDLAMSESEWNRLRTVPASFTETKQKLAAAKVVVEQLPMVRARKLAELDASRRQKQLQHFLESHRIEDAVLPGIGKGRKELLRVYNVEDASDVEYAKISDIKGFGPMMRSTLLAWRASIEQEFRFQPNLGVDPQDLRALDQDLDQKRADAVRLLVAGPQLLQRELDSWLVQRNQVLQQLSQKAQRFAQTELNMIALRSW
jgi:DNA-binding helix-hairpin-helix protein with protein kinase domain